MQKGFGQADLNDFMNMDTGKKILRTNMLSNVKKHPLRAERVFG